MRWFVEISPLGSKSSEETTLCVEAPQWQPALQKARALRGDSGALSNFSIELLDDGYRAIDPGTRLRYIVRRAPDDAALTPGAMSERPPAVKPAAPAKPAEASKPAEPAGPARQSAPTVGFGSAGAAIIQPDPPKVPQVATAAAPAPEIAKKRPAAQTVGFTSSGSAIVNAGAPAAGEAPIVEPENPAEKPAAALPSFVVVGSREDNPTESSPLTYREYVYAVAQGTSDDDARALILERFAHVRAGLDAERQGKLINLAVFDHIFHGRPQRRPVVTLTWKDWKGDAPELHFPGHEASGDTPTPYAPTAKASVPAPTMGGEPPKPPERKDSASLRSAEPSKPVEMPAEPAKAETPKPVPAEKPAEPVKPVASTPKPVPAAKPAEPAKAEAPKPVPAEKPVEPAKPVVSTPKPVPVEKPVEPVKAEAPKPVPAAKPAEPAKAATPKPAEPAKTETPKPVPAAKPAEPAKAATPKPADKPAEPAKPAKVAEVAKPAPAAKPAAPKKRLTGDDLLAELFEAFGDLHFARDSLEGAEFVLQLTQEKIPSEVGLVSLFDMNTREFVVVRQSGGAKSALCARQPERAPLALSAMRRRHAIVVSDAAGAERAMDDRFRAIGVQIRSLICSPIELSGRYLGLIELCNPVDGHAFNEGDGNALTYIGQQFAEFVAQRGVIVDPAHIRGEEPKQEAPPPPQSNPRSVGPRSAPTSKRGR